MKNHIKPIIFLIVSSLMACGGLTKEDTVTAQKNYKIGTDLQSDNGKPWLANIETTEGINNMISYINTFANINDIESYSELKESLDKEFLLIFKKCTMKGESHIQLHNYLIPMKGFLEDLDSDELKKCQETYGKFVQHLNQYK